MSALALLGGKKAKGKPFPVWPYHDKNEEQALKEVLESRVWWRTLLPSAIITGIFYGALGVFSRFYFSDTIISDSKTYGTIGAIFGIMTWFIAVGAVIILGAVAGAVWEDRKN